MVRLVSHAHMQCITVCIAIDRNARQTKFPTGTNDAQRNFTPVSNQDFLKRPGSRGGKGRHNWLLESNLRRFAVSIACMPCERHIVAWSPYAMTMQQHDAHLILLGHSG